MIPQTREFQQREASEVLPTKTYKIDFENKRIIGTVDGRDAVIQFIRKALNTDKYAFEIYNWRYGNELRKLVGHSYDYVVTRLPNIIKEALMVDDRIIDVRDFTFDRVQADAVQVSFVIDTAYGQIVYEQEVLT